MSTKLEDRIKRFFRALNAKIESSDKVIVEEYLDNHHQKVFFSMSLIDQRHSIDVACTLLNSDKDYNDLTVRLALLHDIGKQVQRFYLMERVTVVVFPRKKLKLNPYPYEKNLLKKAWQLKNFHPQYGSIIAMENNFEPELIEMIRCHHNIPPICKEVEDFQWADNLN